MNIFDITQERRRECGAKHTIREIHQQPETWEETAEQLKNCQKDLQEFLARVWSREEFTIVLAGAGTSEFVGNALLPSLRESYQNRIRSCATTDIVPSPQSYLSASGTTLLVSFGRSGNSPESLGALEAAEAVCQKLYHLLITCNEEGELSRYAKGRDNCFALNLTEKTHDRSFAMTSSFTNMYLAALLALGQKEEESEEKIKDIAGAAEEFLGSRYQICEKITEEYDFERIVYLGSDCLKGIAQESALKMLELTAGKVAAVYDSPLGFRHGPKSIINDKTLTVIYFSGEEEKRRYERDLLREMSRQRKGNRIVAVTGGTGKDLEGLADYLLTMETKKERGNVWQGLLYILFAQTLAVYKSLSLGISPDNPCPTGEVNRVVKGVTLYPFEKGRKGEDR